MRIRARAVTVGVLVLVLGVIVALTVRAADRSPDEQASTASPAEPGASVPPKQSVVRLPDPVAGPGPRRGSDTSAERLAKREARQRRALVPELPDLAAGTLECIEAVARRRTLSAATFNIHGGFGGGDLNLDGIAREIAGMDADVILLQEVDRGRKRSRRQNQARILGARLGMNVAYDSNSARRSGGTIGNAVLSRFPITGARRAPLPRGGSEPRGVMRVTVSIENVQVAIYVTHLEHTSPRARQRQMRYIAGALRREALPHLLGGDLNATPGSSVLDIARGAMSDVWPATGTGLGRTVPRARIDYLMTSETVRPLGARVVPSRISDHDAVLAGFEVGPPRACRQGP